MRSPVCRGSGQGKPRQDFRQEKPFDTGARRLSQRLQQAVPADAGLARKPMSISRRRNRPSPENSVKWPGAACELQITIVDGGDTTGRLQHLYEAILATFAILIWHFYAVIFDPDIYPLRWTFLTGRAPEYEMREESGKASAPRTGAPESGEKLGRSKGPVPGNEEADSPPDAAENGKPDGNEDRG